LLDVGITPGSTALVVTVIAATFVATTNTSTVLASVNLLTSGNSQTYKEPEIVESYSMQVRNYTTSTGEVYEMPYSDAVEVKDGQIHFHPSKMLKPSM
jgi:ketosteroid isomerase-like protein